jgi:hypothetical protein
MFGKGDVVTFSASPVIKLADYQYLKPQATVTRTLQGTDQVMIANELDAIKTDLRYALLQSLLTELEFDNEIASVLAECETLEEIAAWAMKEMGYGPQGEDGKKNGSQKGPGKKPRKR